MLVVDFVVDFVYLSVVEIRALQVGFLKSPYLHNQNHHLLIHLFKSNITFPIVSMSTRGQQSDVGDKNGQMCHQHLTHVAKISISYT